MKKILAKEPRDSHPHFELNKSLGCLILFKTATLHMHSYRPRALSELFSTKKGRSPCRPDKYKDDKEVAEELQEFRKDQEDVP